MINRGNSLKHTVKVTKFSHNENDFYLCALKAKTLTEITYVARRGIDQEKGAIQRILNKRRISKIRDFLLNGGFFPNNVILNVKEEGHLLYDKSAEKVSFELNPKIAQIIDGQHRVEGLKEAIKNDASIGEILIPTVLVNDVSTEICAELFININTEQKPVPQSLIYDLYGLMDVSARDFSIERGTDIARMLNDDDNSPYQGYIKFPGSRKFKGGIQVSAIVNSLKSLVKKEGEFSKYSLTTLQYQASVLKNYFSALQNCYGDEWASLHNPFLFASGFGAAIEVYVSKILPYCFSHKNFTEGFINDLILFSKKNLITQAEVKGKSGEAARELIKLRIIDNLKLKIITEEEFKI